MEKYPTYKHSGIKWIGEIPEHWVKLKLKYFSTCNDCALSDKEDNNLQIQYVEIGDVDLVNGISKSTNYRFAEAPSRARRITQKDDVIISTVRTYLKAIAHVDRNGLIVSTGFAVLRPKKINSKYMSFALSESHFIDSIILLSTGINYPAITPDKLVSIKIPIPPDPEQQAIVTFLEKQTSNIDAYIKLRNQEIIALEELKRAEIANVVTKGLNPNVKMKDSGIPWIGQILEHWDCRYLFQVSKEHFISNKNVRHQNLLSLSYGKIINKDINTADGLLPASFDTYQIVEDGNIILRLTDLQNDHKSLRVGLVTQEGIITSAYVCLEAFKNMMPKYLYYLLHSFDIKKVFYSMGGGLRQGLNYDELRKLNVVVPPKEEQQQIVEYIESRVAKIEEYISTIKSEIEQMQEYKQCLISNAVTGKVDVRNVVVEKIEDETEESVKETEELENSDE